MSRTRLGNLRVRVHDASISIHLHEGYDWIRTRRAIEEEIKAVRRRLAKIRQLLASGQKADESLDKGDTGSTLFNSVYIGLDQNQDGLDDPAALLAAIDDELEDGTEMNTQSSWQTLPGGPAGTERKKIPSSRLNGKRLTRSKKAQIEINLDGIKADYDIYDPTHDIASRVHTTIQSLEILDHIKTSTWKKFLTEMKSDARGNVRETDADMVRIELVSVRPSPPSSTEESRLKVSSEFLVTADDRQRSYPSGYMSIKTPLIS
jgi:autophagy-related protein 2